MKKLLSLVLAVLMLAATLCACTGPADDGSKTPEQPEGPEVIDVNAALADESKWEFDCEDVAIKDGKLVFDTVDYGSFAAAMLKQPAKNATWKFTVTVNSLGDGVVGHSDWWDAELLFLARSSVAGPGWRDDGSQTGYSITSWGEMKEVCIGRAGKDDLATFEWNIADGQPHEIELSVVSNEDDSVVTITLKVDGQVIGTVEDDGSEIKNDRPASYPDAGNLTIRAKWVAITIG